MFRGVLSFALAIGVSLEVLLASGCAGASGRTAPARLVASARPYVDDLPVPEGFTLIEPSGEGWSNATARFLRHRYVGRADKTSVRAFYQREMPLVRWSANSDVSAPGRYTMRFTRANETCVVDIRDDDSRFRRRVYVDVVIAPALHDGSSEQAIR